MLTRGYLIGAIIDNLTQIQTSIETRNKLKLFDVDRFAEDFFKKILNILKGINLANLNEQRENNPGLDLGDLQSRQAYQVTADRRSEKIVRTLETISEEQRKQYDSINILVLGKKQSTYTVSQELCDANNFSIKENILDITDLLSLTMYCDFESLRILQELTNNETNKVLIELEIPDETGKYATTPYNFLESLVRPSLRNIKKVIRFAKENYGLSETHDKIFQGFQKYVGNLKQIPRYSREFLSILVEMAEDRDGLLVDYRDFSRRMRLAEQALINELSYLESKELLKIKEEVQYLDEDEQEGVPYKVIHIGGHREYNGSLAIIKDFVENNGISMRSLMSSLNFDNLSD